MTQKQEIEKIVDVYVKRWSRYQVAKSDDKTRSIIFVLVDKILVDYSDKPEETRFLHTRDCFEDLLRNRDDFYNICNSLMQEDTECESDITARFSDITLTDADGQPVDYYLHEFNIPAHWVRGRGVFLSD